MDMIEWRMKGAKVVAVGGRSEERAKEFAQKWKVPNAYGTYDGVAQDREVELIYVCTLHPEHLEAVRAAASAGKAILCEKPLAHNARDAAALVALAQEAGVFFMEGMWARYFPAVQRIRKEVKEGRIGEIIAFDAKLGYKPDPTLPRISQVECGASALLDVGIYPISMASMMMGGEEPTEIKAHAFFYSPSSFDAHLSALLKYPSGAIATIQGSHFGPLSNDATITGTKGRIHWKNFWCPDSFSLTLFPDSQSSPGSLPQITHFCADSSLAPPGSQDRSNEKIEIIPSFALPLTPLHPSYFFPRSNGLAFEITYFQLAVSSSMKESQFQPISESLSIMRTIDSIARSIGFDNYWNHEKTQKDIL